MNFIPSYVSLLNSGEFEKRILSVESLISNCNSCPRSCLVNRGKGELGYCKSGYMPVVSSYGTHFGEEPVLSGENGAGNIFFGNCNLKCAFCQNYEISQNWIEETKHEISYDRLADIMIELQNKNCHNIGLVSPTHFSVQIIKSIYLAAKKGLRLPIIYNSNGYDSVELLKLFDGLIDIYLPDFKYGNNDYGNKYSNVPDYFDQAKKTIKEMYAQVGDELVFEGNVMVRGLIIRHLVLPNGLAESEQVFKFIAEELSKNISVSLMSQYFPANKAHEDNLINRTLLIPEYNHALDLLEKYGLHHGWLQEMDSNETYRPSFNRDRLNPFT
jgi:putative pyruvate formate lyase activating enzyme